MKSIAFSSINKWHYNDHATIDNHSSSRYQLVSSASSNHATFTRMGIALKHKFGRAFNSYNYKIYGIRLATVCIMSDCKGDDLSMSEYKE